MNSLSCISINSKCHGEENCNLWNIQDVLIFIAMGFVGGLLGAWFNALNKHLTVHRILHDLCILDPSMWGKVAIKLFNVLTPKSAFSI